jgi:hypothetical protein
MFRASTLAVGSSLSLVRWMCRFFSGGKGASVNEADHSLPSNAELRVSGTKHLLPHGV